MLIAAALLIAGTPGIVAEAQAFMTAYALDLRTGDRAALVQRYDQRGVWSLGDGYKALHPIAKVASTYMGGQWNPPAAFEWQDLDYEPVGRDAVAVVGKFQWTRANGVARVFSYSSLLVKRNGKLRIRIEDESTAAK